MTLRYRVQCWACEDTYFYADYRKALLHLSEHTYANRTHIVTLDRVESTDADAKSLAGPKAVSG